MKTIIASTLSLLLAATAVHSDPSDYEVTRSLAEQGDPYYQLFLANRYDNGIGVAENDAEAFKWYRKAADQGMPAGQNSLGVMYANGIVVPQDYLAAYIWFYMAAVQSHEGASNSKEEVAAKLTAEQLDRGQRLAIRCIESRYTNCDLK